MRKGTMGTGSRTVAGGYGRSGMASFARVAMLASALVVGGCSGETDGGKGDDANFDDEVFVPDETNSGQIIVRPNETRFPVGDTTGFRVQVLDASGQGVPNIRVLCDSELGVAILEPTTGSELTNSSGHMSGRIGCALPGSFQFGCRLPVGTNIRQFVDIVCTGDVPEGFNGFPGAAGGGVGGGVQVVDDGDPGNVNANVRITAINVFDDGSAAGGAATNANEIDTVQGACGDEPEPFFNTQFSVEVVNDSNRTIRFNSLRYSLTNADGQGGRFTSGALALGSGDAPSQANANGGVTTLSTLAIEAREGRKFFFGSATPIPVTLGIQNVTVRIFGSDSDGNPVEAAARTAMSFTNFNNCN